MNQQITKKLTCGDERVDTDIFFVFRFLFNDAEVKQFDPNQIATECFGGEMTVRLCVSYV